MNKFENLSEQTTLIQQGFAYWLSKCDNDPMPKWQDIKPDEIKRLLPSIVVIHVLSDPLDFIERITGEKILEHSTLNSMGKNWRDYEGRGPGSNIWKAFSNVVETGEPSFQSIPYVGPHREFMKVQSVICPISDDGIIVNKIITFVDFCAPTNDDYIEE